MFAAKLAELRAKDSLTDLEQEALDVGDAETLNRLWPQEIKSPKAKKAKK